MPEQLHEPLQDDAIAARLATLVDWTLDGQRIVKTYPFANYYETMAFVNALAWIAHRSDHHPDLEVGYNRCTVRWTSHAAGGLTVRDFDSAAQADALFLS